MIEKFEQWLKENSITEVECLVPDLGGIARGKILPTKKFINQHLHNNKIFVVKKTFYLKWKRVSIKERINYLEKKIKTGD